MVSRSWSRISFSVLTILGTIFSSTAGVVSPVFVSRALAVGGYSAADMVGQLNGANTPFYTSSAANDTPNTQGFNIAVQGSALDEVRHRLFVSDTYNNRVLVFNLDASNVLLDRSADYVLGQPDFKTTTSNTTQNGLNAPGSLAYDDSADFLYVADQNNIRVLVYDVNAITNGMNAVNVLGQTDFVSTAFGTAQNTFNSPSSVAIDTAGSRLFVTDRSNSRTLVFDVTAITDGENAVNVLGQPDFTTGTGATTQAKQYQPTGLAYDAAGNRLFVSDTTNNRVVVYDVTAIVNGENAVNVLGQPDFTTLATATTQAKLYIPSGVAYDAAGNRLFVADSGRNRVMIFDTTAIVNGENAVNVLGQALFTTNAAATTQSGLTSPTALSFDAGGNKLYVPDSSNRRVMIFDVAAISDGENATDVIGQIDGADAPFFTSGGDNNAPNAHGFNTASNVAVDTTNHRLFVSDEFNRRVLVFNLDASNQLLDHTADYVLGQTNYKTAAGGTTQSKLNRPTGLAYDATGNRLFVADYSNNRVMVFDVTAITDGENAANVLGQLDFVTATAGTTQGTLSGPRGLAYDATGHRLFVADNTNNRVMVFDVTAITDGEDAVNVLGQLDFFSSLPDVTQSAFDTPEGVAIDETGNRLFVTDGANSRVMVFDVTAITDGENAVNVLGQADFVSGAGSLDQNRLSSPYGVAFDSVGSRLFVADNGNNRVMVFDVTAITDGENAADVYGQTDFVTGSSGTTQSTLSAPYGITFNAVDSVLSVVDQGNSRVMMFSVAAAPPAPTPTPTPAPSDSGGGTLPVPQAFRPLSIIVAGGLPEVGRKNVTVTLTGALSEQFSSARTPVNIALSNDSSFATYAVFRETSFAGDIPDKFPDGTVRWERTLPWDLCFGSPGCVTGKKTVYARFYVNVPVPSPEATFIAPSATACKPRPACLDANPICTIPTPDGGWCPQGQQAGAGANVVQATRAVIDTPGLLTAVCKGWPAPYVELAWSAAPPPGGILNSNSVLRSVNGAAPTWFFGGDLTNPPGGVSGVRIDGTTACAGQPCGSTTTPNLSVQDLKDTGVVDGVVYSYRVKYSPSSASNTVAVSVSQAACSGDGTPAATPSPVAPAPAAAPTVAPAQLSLHPVSQSVAPNVSVLFTASGGTGVFSWYAPGGSPEYGAGAAFGTLFTNASTAPVSRTVYLTSGAANVSANIFVDGVQTFQDDTALSGAPSTASVVVNDDAPATTIRNVTLTLRSPYAPGSQMRIANEPTLLPAASFVTLASTTPWDLCSGVGASCRQGMRTVYVEFAAANGEAASVQVFDSIYYDPAGGLPPISLVSINDDAPTTASNIVTLTLDHGFSNPARDEVIYMRLGNSKDALAVAPWEAFAPVKSWDLCAGGVGYCASGQKAVWAQFSNGPMQTVATDTIQYVNANPDPGTGRFHINDGAPTTKTRIVSLALAHPFTARDANVRVRIIGSDELTPEDRDIIAAEGGGIRTDPTLSTKPPVSGGPDGGPTPARIPRPLSGGIVVPFSRVLQGVDLCARARQCPGGTYVLYTQFIAPKDIPIAQGAGKTYGVLGDEYSFVYVDSIAYSPPLPPSPTPLPPSPSPAPSVPPPSPAATPSPVAPPATSTPPTSGGSTPTGGGALSGVQDVVGPVSATTVVAALASGVAALLPIFGMPGGFSGFLGFIWQGFLGMLGLLPARKKLWGTVYDSQTKRPIPFANVQLLDSAKRVLETRIADRDGRYGFLTTPESLMAQNITIQIVATRQAYTFPSQRTPTVDTYVYGKIYRGELVTVNEQTLINFDIPMDPVAPSAAPLVLQSPSIALGASIAALADAGFWLGVITVPLNFILAPNPFTFGVLMLFVGTSSLRLFGFGQHPYGVTINASGKPVPFALITINSLTGKRVAFAVSDERGRYFAVVPGGDYEVAAFTPATVFPGRVTREIITTKQGWITRRIQL